MKLTRSCPICENNTGSELQTIKMDIPSNIKLTNKYNIVSCNVCGSCFANTSSSAEDYDDYYCNHNYYGWWRSYNSSSESDYLSISRILDKWFDKTISVADMWCWNWKLLSFLKEKWYKNIIWIDPSYDSINELDRIGIQWAIGSVYGKPDKNFKKAKIVIMTMVLEHLLEPLKAIKNITDNYLADDWYIIVTWPHFEDLLLDNSPILNNFNHEHINYFSVKSADWLFGRCGFTRIEKHISICFNHNDNLQFSNIVLYKINLNNSQKNIKDETTAESINEYVSRVQNRELKFIKSIDQLSQTNKDVIVWGTWAYTMHLMANSSLSKCNISCFVDNNKLRVGGTLYGKPVKSPEIVKKFSGTVVVTAMLYWKDIWEQIRKMGNNNCEILII